MASARPGVDPNPGFLEQLRDFSREVTSNGAAIRGGGGGAIDGGGLTAPSLLDVATALIDELRVSPSGGADLPAEVKELHPQPPFVPKRRWTELGDLVRAHEARPITHIPGECATKRRLRPRPRPPPCTFPCYCRRDVGVAEA